MCCCSLSSEWWGRLYRDGAEPNAPLILYSLSLLLYPPSGAPLDPTYIFQSITANIICSIVFGERFDYKDRQFRHMLELIYQTISLISSFSSQVSGWEERSIEGRGKKRLRCE